MQDEYESVPIQRKHDELASAGWRLLDKFEGLLTKYLPPPGNDSEPKPLNLAYFLMRKKAEKDAEEWENMDTPAYLAEA